MAKKRSLRAGHVYILTNEAFRERYVKIGKTTRDPKTRADELSNHTGVPMAFEVAFSVETSDCHTLEKIVHERLAEKRINQRREFFEVELQEAVTLLAQLAREIDAPQARFRFPRLVKIMLWIISVIIFAFIFSMLVRV